MPKSQILKQHDTEIRIRYEDADAMGFLHHSKYFVYFEIGRTEMLRSSGGNYRAMEAEGWFAVVVRASCRYHKPARYDDLVTVRTQLVSISPAKIEHAYELRRGDEVLATADVTLALVDRDGRVQRVPDWLLETARDSSS